jgi:hypothetical protein
MGIRHGLAGGFAALSLLGLAACGEMPGAEDEESGAAEQSEGDDDESDSD